MSPPRRPLSRDLAVHRRVPLTLLLGAVAVLALPRPAHAYIDPGTGSLVLQILIAGFLGLLFALKRMWGRIRAFLANLFS